MQIAIIAHNADTLAEKLTQSLVKIKHDIVPLAEAPDIIAEKQLRAISPTIVIAEPTRLTRLWSKWPALWPEVKWVQSTFAGIEVLIPYARIRGFMLTRMYKGFAQPMAEYVFGHILAIRYRHQEFRTLQQNAVWDMRLAPILKGESLGLLGTGSVTTMIQRIAQLFGMQMIGVNRRGKPTTMIQDVYAVNRLHEAAAKAKIWVNTLPLTEATKGLIDRNFFAQIAGDAIFINVGRGQTVNENDLLAWLNAHPQAHAVCDVFCEEPLPKHSPLWQQENLFITPHMAAKSQPDDVVKLFAENLNAFVHDQPLKGKVDLEQGY